MNNEHKSPGLSSCPYCSSNYKEDDYETVCFEREKEILYVKCSKCDRAMMLNIIRNQEGMTCSGIFTDLSFKDAKRFWNSRSITIDDVIEVHKALKLDNYTRIG